VGRNSSYPGEDIVLDKTGPTGKSDFALEFTLTAALSEFSAEIFGLQETDIADGKIVSLKKFRAQRSRKLTC
jgi:hypothetical protein